MTHEALHLVRIEGPLWIYPAMEPRRLRLAGPHSDNEIALEQTEGVPLFDRFLTESGEKASLTD